MSTLPHILINCDFDEQPAPQSFLRRSYFDSVVRAGGVPLLMPALRDRQTICRLLDITDGILLSGGDDPNPARYGEPLHAATFLMNPDKEESDFLLVAEALKTGKPILGICWGMQLVNVACGGSLVQDIPSQVGTAVVHRLPQRQSAYHDVEIVADSSLAGLVRGIARSTEHGAQSAEHRASSTEHRVSSAEPNRAASVSERASARDATNNRYISDRRLTAMVNSFHHQAVKNIGKDMRAVAFATDGVVEALEGRKGQFLLCVQWHPERMPDDPLAQAIFRAFVDSCRKALEA